MLAGPGSTVTLRCLMLCLLAVIAGCTSGRDLPEPLRNATSAPTTAAPATPPSTPASSVAVSQPTTAPSRTPLTTVDDRCAAAAAAVDAAGIHTVPGFEFRCPADARDENGVAHWGITCYGYIGLCAPGTGYIEINVDKIGRSDARLRYVIAHERCHSLEIVATGNTTEEAADACAAAIGFARQTPVYDFAENVIYIMLGLAVLLVLLLIVRMWRTPITTCDD